MDINSWKTYNDEWNNEIFSLDNENKINIFNSTDEITINISSEQLEDKLPPNHINTTIDDIQNIINIMNINELNDLEILNNIIKVLGWAITNCDVNETNYNTFTEAVNWICKCIEYFMKELCIPEITNKQNVGLVRSSYKLCPQKSNCIYQYPDNTTNNNSCKFQHYPYASLSVDCSSIVTYINSYFNSKVQENLSKTTKLIMALTKSSISDKDINLGELKRCLTTINFVFMIMYRELDTIDKCRKHEPNYNIRKYHCYHQPFRFTDKKNGNRTRKYTKFNEL